MDDLLGIKAAAQLCGVSQDTIKRRIRERRFPGAIRGPASGDRPGPWLIPRKDLRGAGLLDEPNEECAAPRPTDLHAALAAKDAIIQAQTEHLADLRVELRHLHEVIAGLGLHGRDCAVRSRVDLRRRATEEEVHAG